MNLYKVCVFASSEKWNVSVKKYIAKETKSCYMILDYCNKRILKDTIGVAQNLFEREFTTKYMYLLQEELIAPIITYLVTSIRHDIINHIEKLNAILEKAPTGEINPEKIVIEDTSIKPDFKLTDDMF